VAANESLDIAGPAGRLEALLMLPERDPVAAGVVCHAHPRHGGMMHFKVVFRAAKALQHGGVATLRFNFRGVGRSEGVHDDGRGEQDDVRAALAALAGRLPGLPVVLGGFSFGALMAMRVGASDPSVRALFALGFPLSMAGDVGFLDGCRTPRLFVQGELDPYGTGERMRELTDRLPQPRAFVQVDGADHFFGGQLDRLQQIVSAWIDGRPWEQAG
jgi:alpha/beta superfamily hydrolase